MIRRPVIGFAALLVALSAPAALAQGRPQPSQEHLKASRDAKYQAAWFTSNPWMKDYALARQKAKETGKLIFAYFLPSYFN